jgi:MFS superfamily sulfate permease-like transporter
MKSVKTNLSPFKNFHKDIPSSIVVFLVALPLCLGIALASGAPAFSGIIAGIVGGIVVGSASGSALGVSGPAAGLVVIVLNAITDLGGFEIFLVAVIIAGFIQILLGVLKAGLIAYYFPSSVIHGMLAGIGISIFLKQIPHAFGYDKDPEGELEFFQAADNQNTFSELVNMIDYINYGALLITVISLAIMIFWQNKIIQKNKVLALIPGSLVAVITGILLTILFQNNPTLSISEEHLVSLPIASSVSDFFGNFTLPDFNAFLNPQVYITAIIIAVVASLETLLCVEASDKQDDLKRITPTNRELVAQGVGNIASGLIGGLPITQVIVRSSANQQAGGRTKMSSIIHGFLLLISVISIPTLLNMIPLATLAAILLIVGFKLAKPTIFRKIYKQGWGQFLPFLITILGILFTDLLYGILMGLVVAVIIILRQNFILPYEIDDSVSEDKKHYTIRLSENVTFLNKASILNACAQMADGSTVVIDGTKTKFIHYDVLEMLEDFRVNASARDIQLEFKNIDLKTAK